MGKKKSGTTYTSKGERRNVSKHTTKGMKRNRSVSEKLINQIAAHRKGKNVVLTIPNPNKNETNKRYIKVKAVDHWGPGLVDRYIIK